MAHIMINCTCTRDTAIILIRVTRFAYTVERAVKQYTYTYYATRDFVKWICFPRSSLSLVSRNANSGKCNFGSIYYMRYVFVCVTHTYYISNWNTHTHTHTCYLISWRRCSFARTIHLFVRIHETANYYYWLEVEINFHLTLTLFISQTNASLSVVL